MQLLDRTRRREIRVMRRHDLAKLRSLEPRILFLGTRIPRPCVPVIDTGSQSDLVQNSRTQSLLPRGSKEELRSKNESRNTSCGLARGMRESAACAVSNVDFGADGGRAARADGHRD